MIEPDVYGPYRRFDQAVEHFVNKKTGEPQVSLAKQEMQEACNINNLMSRYVKTGEITHLNLVPPQYGDFTTATEYQDAMNALAQANQAFAELPVRVRNRFENDPAQLIDFMADQKNYEEGQQLGLYNPTPPPEPAVVEPPAPDDPPGNTDPS